MLFMGLASPLSSQGFNKAASNANTDPITLWAVVSVETSGKGFLPDRRPQILFERHIFSKQTSRRYDMSNPEISAASPGGYGRQGSNQYARLAKAMVADRRAALESASWGLGQIMGFNAALAGYQDVEDMVVAMMRSEDDQILAMTTFLRSTKIHKTLELRDWAAFARAYNGPTFAKNRYDAKLADAHERFSASGLPNLDARAVQMLLLYHGFDPGTLDGVMGVKTKSAIAAFSAKHKLNLPSTADRELLQILTQTLPPAADSQVAQT
jgi:hypothetical protein